MFLKMFSSYAKMKDVGKNQVGKPGTKGSNLGERDLAVIQELTGNPFVVSRRHLVVAPLHVCSSGSQQHHHLSESNSKLAWESFLSESRKGALKSSGTSADWFL